MFMAVPYLATERVLPTYLDVMKSYLHERQLMKYAVHKTHSMGKIS